MSEATAKQELKRLSIEAVVIRADGTREDLGVISEWNKGDEEPSAKRPFWQLKRKTSN